MLVASSRVRASKASKWEQIALFVSGACLCLIILIFSVVYVGYQGSWYSFVHKKVNINEPLLTYTDFITAMNEESNARVNTTADVSDKVKATDAALAEFIDDVGHDNGASIEELQRLFAKYREAGNLGGHLGSLLTLHLSIVQEACALLFSLIHATLSVRPRAAVNSVLTEATVAAYSSVAARSLFLHGAISRLDSNAIDTTVKPEAATRLMVHVTMAETYRRLAQVIGDDGIAVAHASLLNSLLAPAREIIDQTFGFAPAPSSANTLEMPSTVDALQGLTTFLSTREETVEANVREALTALMLVSVGAALVVLALLLTVCVLWRYHSDVEPTRRLAAAFENPARHRWLRLRYLPLLQDLRAVRLPSDADAEKISEVEREYLITARAVDTLRVAAPQLLMCGSRQVSGPSSIARSLTTAAVNTVQAENGEAAMPSADSDVSPLLGKPARLELGSSLCMGAVVMEFNVFLAHTVTHFTQNALNEHFDAIGRFYRVVVEEVNRSGGVVIGFSEGLNILCAWNINASSGTDRFVQGPESVRAGEATAEAVRVSWIVRYRLQKEERLLALPTAHPSGEGEGADSGDRSEDDAEKSPNAPSSSQRPITHLCACIVSGPAVLSNDEIVGDRRDASLQGGLLANLERMRMIAKTTSSSTLIDGSTHNRLPTTWQRRSCKPLVVLKSPCGSGTIDIFSASEEDGSMTGDQAVLYNTGFVFYQNNMVTEAVHEFTRYLALYPNDKRAWWLMNNVLLPRQCNTDAN